MPPIFDAERHHWVNCSSPGPPVVLTTHIKVLSRSIGCAVRLNGSRVFCTQPFLYPLYGKPENGVDITAPDRRVNGSVYRWITANNRHIIVRYASRWPLLSWQGRVWIIPRVMDHGWGPLRRGTAAPTFCPMSIVVQLVLLVS